MRLGVLPWRKELGSDFVKGEIGHEAEGLPASRARPSVFAKVAARAGRGWGRQRTWKEVGSDFRSPSG